jgi:hypothetical protein
VPALPSVTLGEIAGVVVDAAARAGEAGRPRVRRGAARRRRGAVRARRADEGQITPAQFADLSAKIGGVDVDIDPTEARVEATEQSLANAYRSGAINTTNNQAGLAIIDLRGPDPGAFHDAYRTWAIRARLEREQGGQPRNHVIWFGETPLIGDPNWATEGMQAMDRWLTGREHRDGHEQVPVEAATALGPLPEVVHRRPVGDAGEGVPDRRVRLEQARRRAAGHDPMADLPGPRRRGGLRWPTARRGAEVLRRRLDERRVRELEGRENRLIAGDDLVVLDAAVLLDQEPLVLGVVDRGLDVLAGERADRVE